MIKKLMKRNFLTLGKKPLSWSAALSDCWKSTRGAVSVELAFVAIILSTLAVGAFDFGRYGIEKTRVTSAARAGAQYAVQDLSTANDSAGITAAARYDASDTNNVLTITLASPPSYCVCDGATVSCASTCSDGNYAPRYIDVTVSKPVDLLFNYPGVPTNITVSATSTLRVK